jgi:methylenetetrahydrofolate--tRNA-(uracil-5-)-methyltransferase
VEGYVESIAAGLVAGLNSVRWLEGKTPLIFPPETAIGALLHYIINAEIRHFQPMNINLGLFPPLNVKIRGKGERGRLIAERALKTLEDLVQNKLK